MKRPRFAKLYHYVAQTAHYRCYKGTQRAMGALSLTRHDHCTAVCLLSACPVWGEFVRSALCTSLLEKRTRRSNHVHRTSRTAPRRGPSPSADVSDDHSSLCGTDPSEKPLSADRGFPPTQPNQAPSHAASLSHTIPPAFSHGRRPAGGRDLCGGTRDWSKELPLRARAGSRAAGRFKGAACRPPVSASALVCLCERAQR